MICPFWCTEKSPPGQIPFSHFCHPRCIPSRFFNPDIIIPSRDLSVIRPFYCMVLRFGVVKVLTLYPSFNLGHQNFFNEVVFDVKTSYLGGWQWMVAIRNNVFIQHVKLLKHALNWSQQNCLSSDMKNVYVWWYWHA